MVSRIWSVTTRRSLAILGAIAMGAGSFAASAHAEDVAPVDEKPAFTLSLQTDFTSHFISYGADVWGGGSTVSPFSSRSTIFENAVLGLELAKNDQFTLKGFVNVWADINNNTESDIGGRVQEIDLNTGLSLSAGKWGFSLANGFWNYAGDIEKVLDFTASYDDTDMLIKGFAFKPAITVHYRYDGNNGQKTGFAIVPGIAPGFTIDSMKDYPITITFPVNVGLFTDSGFQGGDSGYGFFNAGAAVSVPLAFIPKKYGAWYAGASITYWNTPHSAIPGNPEDNFFVGDINVGVNF